MGDGAAADSNLYAGAGVDSDMGAGAAVDSDVGAGTGIDANVGAGAAIDSDMGCLTFEYFTLYLNTCTFLVYLYVSLLNPLLKIISVPYSNMLPACLLVDSNGLLQSQTHDTSVFGD